MTDHEIWQLIGRLVFSIVGILAVLIWLGKKGR